MPTTHTPDLAGFEIAKPVASFAAPPPATSKDERKQKGFRIRKAAAKQLAILKIETERTETDLLTEALNLLFAQHDLPQIA